MNQTAISIFAGWLKDKERADSTRKEYIYNIRAYLDFLGDKPLEQTTKGDILRFLAHEREKRGNQVATRNRKLMAIRTFYKALNEMEALPNNPALGIETAKQPKKEIPIYLDKKTLSAFFELVKKTRNPKRNRAIFLLMVAAGLRVSEVHHLNLHHIHFESKGIQVPGKGKKERFVPVSDELLFLLREVIRERPIPKEGHEQALFLSRNRKRLSTRRIQQLGNEIFEKLAGQKEFQYLQGIKFSCHKLRHTFGTMLIQRGEDLRTIQELMGHESPATTQIYTHISNRQKIKAIQDLSESLKEIKILEE